MRQHASSLLACLFTTACACAAFPPPVSHAPRRVTALTHVAPVHAPPSEHCSIEPDRGPSAPRPLEPAWWTPPAHPSIGLCAATSAEHREASEAFEHLRAQVEALQDDDPPATIRRALLDLLSMRCFALAQENPDLPPVASTTSFREWWREGGEAWLESMLTPAVDPPSNGAPGARRAWFPPTELRAFTLDTDPHSPFAPILCAASDETCGAETAGWLVRANRWLTLRGASDRLRDIDNRSDTDEPYRGEQVRLAACERRGLAAPPAERYATWRECIDADVVERGPALPLGRFRAPQRGWLVILGRRGHYSFCDEARAYDLETGAAHIVSSCSGLALRPDGSVDGDATNAARRERRQQGVLPLDALREAALMTLLSTRVENDARRWGQALVVPAGITASLSEDRSFSMGGGFWSSSAQTLLRWWWVDGGCTRARGTLTWPESSNAGEDYADTLLAVAEAGFVATVAPATLPRGTIEELQDDDAPAGTRGH